MAIKSTLHIYKLDVGYICRNNTKEDVDINGTYF